MTDGMTSKVSVQKAALDSISLARPVFTALPPLALYVHIPWCLKKCPYCDFNSHEVHGEAPEAAYVDALLADLEFALPSIWGRKIVSVFIGGGTPSLFSASAIDRLLGGIRARVPLLPGAEVTLEANPGTFERQKFADFYAAGVNRLSLGIQSFDPAQLLSLGRVHDADEARRAAEAALMIFGNVNFDLMYSLPRQTVADARADLASALAFAPPHLSFYHLTLEPNTLFHRYPPPLPDEDTAADIEEEVDSLLEGAGYQHYETSAHAKPGRQCAHNVNYWRFGDYLGIGAGAHSKLSFANRIVRQLRWKQPKAVPGTGRAGASAAGRGRRGTRRRRVRIHAQRVAPDVGRTCSSVRGAHRLSACARVARHRRRDAQRAARSGTRQPQSHRTRPPLPQ